MHVVWYNRDASFLSGVQRGPQGDFRCQIPNGELLPLLRDALNGRSLVDPEIEDRVQEVRDLDEQSPRALLEPNELRVAELVGQGMTNEQIAARLNLHDKRAVSRTNGRIYAAWGLSETAVDD